MSEPSNGAPLTRAALDEIKDRLLTAADSPPDWTAFCGACRRAFMYRRPPPFNCPHCGVVITELRAV